MGCCTLKGIVHSRGVVRFLFNLFMLLGVIGLGILQVIIGLFRFLVCSQKNKMKKISPYNHAKKVTNVQNQVREYIRSGRKNKMCTARPSYRTLNTGFGAYKRTMTQIHIDMDAVIKVDEVNRSVTVEPLVNMKQLSTYLLRHGWTIPVVPELDALTVGGLVCGAGIETTSHKYGLFNKTCLSYEVVLANGEVVNCSKEENSDLFYSIPMSYGTLGFLTSATIRIIPAKPYIELEYIPVHTLDDAVHIFDDCVRRSTGNEFVEGIMYSLDKGVIMVGNMVDEPANGQVNHINRWYKPMFSKHAESFLKKSTRIRHIEYIPLGDYYHRHSRNTFWVVQYVLPFIHNVFFRYLFGWILPVQHQLVRFLIPNCIIQMVKTKAVFMIQDFGVHLERTKEILIFQDKETQIYPIWLCAAIGHPDPGMIKSRGEGEEMGLDIGVYGISPNTSLPYEETVRKFENYCLQMGGVQIPYADIYMSREKYEAMIDHTLYYKLRKELNCEDAFPIVYDKISRTAKAIV